MEENKFIYEYSATQQEEINKIRQKYIPKNITKMDELRTLDKRVEKAGIIPALTLGIIGTLFLGTGMCCTMVWEDKLFVPGIFIGILGIILILLAAPLNNLCVKRKRKKLAPTIINLTDEILTEQS